MLVVGGSGVIRRPLSSPLSALPAHVPRPVRARRAQAAQSPDPEALSLPCSGTVPPALSLQSALSPAV